MRRTVARRVVTVPPVRLRSGRCAQSRSSWRIVGGRVILRATGNRRKCGSARLPVEGKFQRMPLRGRRKETGRIARSHSVTANIRHVAALHGLRMSNHRSSAPVATGSSPNAAGATGRGSVHRGWRSVPNMRPVACRPTRPKASVILEFHCSQRRHQTPGTVVRFNRKRSFCLTRTGNSASKRHRASDRLSVCSARPPRHGRLGLCRQFPPR